MERLVIFLSFASWLVLARCAEELMLNANDTDPLILQNSTDGNKDMYVIHAMVYQVGILTNKTDNDTMNYNTTGNQEAVTFYHNNGSQVDLSQIGNPLLTNVTAQSMVGVAPLPGHGSVNNTLPWSTLNNLANMPPPPLAMGPQEQKPRAMRDVSSDPNLWVVPEGSLESFYKSLFKRSAPEATTVAIRSGTAMVPESAGVQSIAIPPLMTLNHNMSNIPVPIPNTSVVHYAKINTLVSKT